MAIYIARVRLVSVAEESEALVLGFSRALVCVVLALVGVLGISGTALGVLSPSGREWEMVSPPQKNGGDVMIHSAKVTAAADGDAVTFVSLLGFAGTPGSALAIDYLSVRAGVAGTNGWSTHSLTPPGQEAVALRYSPHLNTSYRLFAPDLSVGLLRAFTPLTDVPNVALTRNLYRRSDLRDPTGGTYALLTDSVNPIPVEEPFGNGIYVPWVADASTDFEHVLFESTLSLTADAPPCADPIYANCPPKVYEWVGGAVRLASILPGGTPAPNAVAGQGAGNFQDTPHTISDDGSRIFFTTNPFLAAGDLFVRIAGSSTAQVNASERTPADPAGPLPARFEEAAADGSAAFFTTKEQLTDDDQDTGVDLYHYAVDAPEGQRLTRLSVGADENGDVLGVVGISDDGSSVYFIAQGQLVDGAPQSPLTRIYLWREGELRDIGGLAITADVDPNTGVSIYELQLKPSRVSPDGRFMLFLSGSGEGLGGYDHAGHNQLYLYDATADELVCASCNPNVTQATGPAAVQSQAGISVSAARPYLNRALSDNGRVFFSSRQRLVPGDVNGAVWDVYEYDPGSRSRILLSSGETEFDSLFMDASADGNDVFFLSREQLSRWDIDQAYDLYDARVGGGLPEPPEPAVPCSGDACQGPPSGRSGRGAPGSVQFGAQSNTAGAGFDVLPLSRTQLRRWAATGVTRLRVRITEAGLVRARVRGRLGGRTRTFASAAQRADDAGTVALTLRLSPPARARLADDRRLRARILVTFSAADGVERVAVTLGGGGR